MTMWVRIRGNEGKEKEKLKEKEKGRGKRERERSELYSNDKERSESEEREERMKITRRLEWKERGQIIMIKGDQRRRTSKANEIQKIIKEKVKRKR